MRSASAHSTHDARRLEARRRRSAPRRGRPTSIPSRRWPPRPTCTTACPRRTLRQATADGEKHREEARRDRSAPQRWSQPPASLDAHRPAVELRPELDDHRRRPCRRAASAPATSLSGPEVVERALEELLEAADRLRRASARRSPRRRGRRASPGGTRPSSRACGRSCRARARSPRAPAPRPPSIAARARDVRGSVRLRTGVGVRRWRRSGGNGRRTAGIPNAHEPLGRDRLCLGVPEGDPGRAGIRLVRRAHPRHHPATRAGILRGAVSNLQARSPAFTRDAARARALGGAPDHRSPPLEPGCLASKASFRLFTRRSS